MVSLKLLNFMLCAALAGSVCIFPSDLSGIWIHSSHGDLRFMTSSMFLMTIDQYENVTGNCHTQVNDDTFIIISDSLSVKLNQNIVINTNIGICLKIEKIKTNLYKLTHLTSELSLADARVVLVLDPSNVQIAAICNDNTTHANTEYNLLMKKGTIDTVKMDCPNDIQGIIDFDMAYQNCSGKMDNCADKTQITIRDSSCNGEIAYTNNNTVVCVYGTSSSGSEILWTYNMDTPTDEKTRYRFTCFVYEVNGTIFTATQNPKFCDFTQTSPSVTSTLGRNINGNISNELVTTDVSSTMTEDTTTEYIKSTTFIETTTTTDTTITSTDHSTSTVKDTTSTSDQMTTSQSSSFSQPQIETSTSTESNELSTTTRGNFKTQTQYSTKDSTTQTQTADAMPSTTPESSQSSVNSMSSTTPENSQSSLKPMSSTTSPKSSQSSSLTSSMTTKTSTQTTVSSSTVSPDLFTGIIASAVIGGIMLVFIVVFIIIVVVYCLTRIHSDQNKRSKNEVTRNPRPRTKRSNNFDRISEPRDYQSWRSYPISAYVGYSGSYQGKLSRDLHKSERRSHHNHKGSRHGRDLDSRLTNKTYSNVYLDPRSINYNNFYDVSRDYYSYPMNSFSQ